MGQIEANRFREDVKGLSENREFREAKFETQMLGGILEMIGWAEKCTEGNKLVIDFDLVGTSVLGYVKVGQTGTVYLSPDLSNMKRADVEHVTGHEVNHNKNGVSDIKLSEVKFSNSHLLELSQWLGLKEGVFDSVNLIEGFNEMATEKSTGTEMDGVYDWQVGDAKKLETFAVKEFGVSLLDLFNKGDIDGFLRVLKKLSDRLLLKKAAQRLKRFGGGIVIENIFARIDGGEFDENFVASFDAAKKIIEGVLLRQSAEAVRQADELLAASLVATLKKAL